MNSYKMVNSITMKDKCESLGLDIDGSGWNISDPFLFIFGEIMTYLSSKVYSSHEDYKEITQADFLALRVPIGVGDWVKCELKNWIRIAKIERLNSDYGFVDTHGIAYELDICTKLTPEQIGVLGL